MNPIRIPAAGRMRQRPVAVARTRANSSVLFLALLFVISSFIPALLAGLCVEGRTSIPGSADLSSGTRSLPLQFGSYTLDEESRVTGPAFKALEVYPVVTLLTDLEYPVSLWAKGSEVYVLENAGRSTSYGGKICLDVYDVMTGAKTTLINNPLNSRAVAVASDGKIYLTAYVRLIPGENGSVSVVDPKTNVETPLLAIEIAARDMFIDSNDDIYIIGSSRAADAKSIYLLPAGDYAHPRVLRTGLGTSWCISKMGEYVYFSDQGAIKRFHVGSEATETVVNKPVMSITFSSEYLYYADYFQGTIGRIKLTTGNDETIVSGLNNPSCVRYDDSSGRLYFVESGTSANMCKDGTLKMLQLVPAYRVEVASEHGTVSGQGIFRGGKTITVTVSPTTIPKDIFMNYVFDSWKDSESIVSTSASYSFTVTASVSLAAKWKTELNMVTVGGIAVGAILVIAVVALIVLSRKKPQPPPPPA